MGSLACGEGSHEEVNNGTAVPLEKAPIRAFSSHPFHGLLLTSVLLYILKQGEPVVKTLFLHKFIVGSLLMYLSLVQDDYPVSLPDG